jgi:hypothetical protein
MPRVGFEHTIPTFEWAKTAHALDHAATVNVTARAEDPTFRLVCNPAELLLKSFPLPDSLSVCTLSGISELSDVHHRQTDLHMSERHWIITVSCIPGSLPSTGAADTLKHSSKLCRPPPRRRRMTRTHCLK